MRILITRENKNFIKCRKCLNALTWLMFMLIIALPVVSHCETIDDSSFSYVADFETKSAEEATNEIIGSVNMLGEDESIGLYLNDRAVSGYDTCTYYSDGDYIDTNGNELYFRPGSPAVSDVTIGFRVNMGAEILTTGTNYSSLSVFHGVIKDVDGDSIPESFSVKDSLSSRQEILRNYHESNMVRIYSYVDGVLSSKELTVSNISWSDVRIEVDFVDADDDSKILYVINTYYNNVLYGTMEIPKTINVSLASSVVGSTGKTVKVSGELDIAGPYLFNFLTANGTLVKDAYIHSGHAKTINSLESVSKKTDFLDKIIVNEQFGDAKLDEGLEALNFGVATKTVGNGYMTLSYTGDGSKTSKDLTDSPVIRMSDDVKNNKYIFRAKYKFNDFKIERCLAQLFSQGDGSVVSHAPVLKTAVGSTLKKSNLLITDGINIIKQVEIANNTWYSAEIVVDVSGTYPSYNVNVTNESGQTVLEGYITSDKATELRQDSAYMQIRMDNSLNEINALSGTTTMYLDDIYFSSIRNIESLRVDDVKIFDGNTVVDTALQHEFGDKIKLGALISNYSTDAVSGHILACQYTANNELVSVTKNDFNISGAYDPYVVNSLPTSESVSLKLDLCNDISYIKVFVLDSIDKLTPYTKIIKLYS